MQKQFPKIEGISTCGYWNGNDKVIHLGDAAEGGIITVNGIDISAADYYVEDYTEKHYQLGVAHQLNTALETLGYYAEWYDAGTLLAYEI